MLVRHGKTLCCLFFLLFLGQLTHCRLDNIATHNGFYCLFEGANVWVSVNGRGCGGVGACLCQSVGGYGWEFKSGVFVLAILRSEPADWPEMAAKSDNQAPNQRQ